MKAPQYHFSFYTNSTRVSMDKVTFPKYIYPFVDKAMQSVSRTGKGLIPFVVYPIFANALMKYDKKWKRDRIFIWKDHVLVGEICEDTPKGSVVCADCGKQMRVVKVVRELTWWQRLIKRVLSGAYEYEPTYKNVCVGCGGEKTQTTVI